MMSATTARCRKKIAEPGGFAHDDTNVIMLVSNPAFERTSYSAEGVQVLPGLK